MRAAARVSRLSVSGSRSPLPLRSRHAVIPALVAALAVLQACATPQAGDAAIAAAALSAPASSYREWTPPPDVPVVEIAGDRLPVRGAEEGVASWYGDPFHGRQTANGEIFDQHALTAAHPTMPLPSLARVTRLDTGASVIVRINDRGPFTGGRVIDLSRAAAEAIGMIDLGVAEVRVEALGPADPQDRAAVSRIVRGPGITRHASRQ
jgi:rare lipoprotein A